MVLEALKVDIVLYFFPSNPSFTAKNMAQFWIHKDFSKDQDWIPYWIPLVELFLFRQ
jgi:hypothetical protein